jgi:hypothetical protein
MLNKSVGVSENEYHLRVTSHRRMGDVGSNPTPTSVPDATVRMTDVLHKMVVRTYMLQVELGKTITRGSIKNSGSLERQQIVRCVMRDGTRVQLVGW